MFISMGDLNFIEQTWRKSGLGGWEHRGMGGFRGKEGGKLWPRYKSFYKGKEIPYDYCFPAILTKYKILQKGIYDNTFSF